jgi:D-tyrosyl-tRNA(Tyr) deacylase
MKLIIQNVDSASVVVNNEKWNMKKYESIWKWILIYFWVSRKTTDELLIENFKSRIDKFVEKATRMRWLKNNEWKLDATINDVGWEILVVSNFTLYGQNKKWTKMDFSASWSYEKAEIIYDYFLKKLKEFWFLVKSGEFWWMMKVASVNDWPINYILDI